MNPSILNSLCYTVGWFWCVFLGIEGRAFLAIIGAILLIFLQLYNIRKRDEALYIQDLILASFSIFLGFFLELFFIQMGVIQYINSQNILPPVWIVCLYPLFSLVLNHSLSPIKKSYIAAFLLGLCVAPLSYFAGLTLNGLTFPYSLIHTWVIVGFCWGLFLCLLIKIANSIEKATLETFADLNSITTLELLYDGECPICKREICFLQKKQTQKNVNFVDISAKEFLSDEHQNIDYETAMSQFHAIDAKGNLLVGIPAFASVYARCQLLVASTLLRIPFISWVLEPFYKLFAKNRLWITGRDTRSDNKE